MGWLIIILNTTKVLTMNKLDLRLAKKKILMCLTEDVKHGKKTSKAIFDKKEGWQCYDDTSLDMVMDKIILGLYLALKDSESSNQTLI